jgi:hypothetical protein
VLESNRGLARLLALAALVAVAVLVVAGCGGSSKKKQSIPTGANAGARIAASPATELGSVQAYTPTGRIVADSGFRPAVNGFRFGNYTTGYQDLTPAAMVDLFGPQVCASRQSVECVLTPPAQAWMAAENQGMQGGHCFGFSVTSLMMYHSLLNPLDFGGPTVPALPLFGNSPLQGRIAESFVLQDSPQVERAFLPGTPNEVLDTLMARLPDKKESYTLGIFNRMHDKGHAVTPYAVEDRGSGKFAVLIYDNNYPNITRAVLFDRRLNTWSYEAAANPQEPSVLFDGDATTNPAVLIPTTPGVGVQPCSFCSTLRRAPTPGFSARGLPASLTPGEYEEVSLAADGVNHGHLLLTDSAGHRTGYVDGKLMNEIPGARVITPLLARNFEQTPEPSYRIPRGVKFTISLDGGELKAPDAESVSVIGPGYSAVASNLTLRPDQRDQLQVTGNGTSMQYQAGAGHTQSPHLELGLQLPGNDYRFAVTAPPLKGGSAVTAVARPAAKQLTLDAAGAKSAGSYSLTVTQLRPSGSQAARGRAVMVPSGGSARVRLGR